MLETAMILAAGRGERLKPLTNFIPKALCEVKGKPLLIYHIENLVKAKFKRIIINHAHLGHQIRRYLNKGQTWNVEIAYAPEPPGGLETGGGIVNALPMLGAEPFLTLNADIFLDFDFASFVLPADSLAHLLLGPNPAHNHQGDFGLAGIRLTNTRQYTFLGVACYHPHIFQRCEIGRYSITPFIRSLALQQKATGELHTQRWADIGNLERLLQCNASP